MKKTVLRVILSLIFVAIFNVFFFVLGGAEHNASVWISYGFIHFAYLMLMLTPVLTPKTKSKIVFGLALYTISLIYFSIVFVIGVIFILAAPESHTVALLIQLLLAGIYGTVLISNMLANERTADAESEQQQQVAYIKDASSMLRLMLDGASDKEIKKNIERVYDAIYSSPVKSHPSLTQIESGILQSINELDDAIFTGDRGTITSLTNSLLSAINERNAKLKVVN